MRSLVGRSFGRVIRPLLAIALVLSAFQIALVAAASSIMGDGDAGGLARLVPGFLQQSLGFALLSFGGLTTLGFFDAIIVMIVVLFAIYLASEPAGDIEAGFVDLVLARPLPRYWLITRSMLVMTSSTIGLMIVMGAALWLGLTWLAPARATWPQPRIVMMMAGHLLMVSWSFGAAALAASGWARRRGAAIGVVAVSGMALYLLDFLATMWMPADRFARLSPFHYFHGGEILAGTASTPRDLTTLGAITIAFAAVAYWRFSKRDLA
jgi:ABC-2 type transport system permease protein